eukprot:gene54041-72222_t
MGTTTSKGIFSDIVSRLLQADVDSSEHEFWDELWKISLSVGDIFSVISPEDVRKLIHERPKNVQTIVTQAIAQLYQVVETPYPVYFDQALTCARLLTRLLPIMLESESKVVKDLLWNRQAPIKPSAPEEDSNGAIETKGSEPLEGEEIATEADAEPLA